MITGLFHKHYKNKNFINLFYLDYQSFSKLSKIIYLSLYTFTKNIKERKNKFI